MFEEASRLKVRFDTPRGLATVEDLWDLPLDGRPGTANLNSIAKELHNQLKDDTRSFVEPEKKEDHVLQLRFDIVLRVIEVRLEETKAAAERQERAQRKQRLLAALARKEDQALENTSADDIRRMIDEL